MQALQRDGAEARVWPPATPTAPSSTCRRLDAGAAHSAAPLSVPPTAERVHVHQVSASVQLDKLRLVVINDLSGRAVPLLSLTTHGLAASCSGSTAHLVLMSDLNAVVELYNHRINR